MSRGDEVYRQLQAKARADGLATGKATPTGEYLTRHALESFLHRLTGTVHADGFVLKGGILLAVYGVRRATKDVDAEAINTTLSSANIAAVVRDLVEIGGDDGVVFDLAALDIQEIRDDAEYTGLRVRLPVGIGTWRGKVAWDISAGDPIVPVPRIVKIPRLLSDDFEMLGYAPETAIAEKGVTILERGVTSTRWRDYVDIVRLADVHVVDADLLLESATAVATFRGVVLRPIGSLLDGYGAFAQPKWAAWRRKEGFEGISHELLDDQVAAVAAVLDPVFARVLPESANS